MPRAVILLFGRATVESIAPLLDTESIDVLPLSGMTKNPGKLQLAVSKAPLSYIYIIKQLVDAELAIV